MDYKKVEYVKVSVLQDDDCHWYCVPFEMTEKFMQAVNDEDYDTIDNDFSQYCVGGALSLLDLYERKVTE